MLTKLKSPSCAALLLLTALLSTVLAGCASPAPSVIPLPEPPKPQAPANVMKPLPEPSAFRAKLKTVFGVSPTKPTK